jgi:hypothetical protein
MWRNFTYEVVGQRRRLKAIKINCSSKIKCHILFFYIEFFKYFFGVVLLRAKKVGHQISVSFEKFDVVQALLSFFLTLFQLTV